MQYFILQRTVLCNHLLAMSHNISVVQDALIAHILQKEKLRQSELGHSCMRNNEGGMQPLKVWRLTEQPNLDNNRSLILETF